MFIVTLGTIVSVRGLHYLDIKLSVRLAENHCQITLRMQL